MIRRPPRSTQGRSSAASDVYKRQQQTHALSPPRLSNTSTTLLTPKLKKLNNSITSIVSYFDTMVNSGKNHVDPNSRGTRRASTSSSSSSIPSPSTTPTSSRSTSSSGLQPPGLRPIQPQPPGKASYKNSYQATEEKLKLGKIPPIQHPKKPLPDPSTPTYGEYRLSLIHI